jgi:hypothetical protein
MTTSHSSTMVATREEREPARSWLVSSPAGLSSCIASFPNREPMRTSRAGGKTRFTDARTILWCRGDGCKAVSRRGKRTSFPCLRHRFPGRRPRGKRCLQQSEYPVWCVPGVSSSRSLVPSQRVLLFEDREVLPGLVSTRSSRKARRDCRNRGWQPGWNRLSGCFTFISHVGTGFALEEVR